MNENTSEMTKFAKTHLPSLSASQRDVDACAAMQTVVKTVDAAHTWKR